MKCRIMHCLQRRKRPSEKEIHFFYFFFIICYYDPFQVYCIKPEGRIHSDNKGAECDYFWRLAITHFLGQLAGYLFHNSCDIICALFSYPPSGAIIGLELARGNCEHYDFLRLHYKRHNIKYVSPSESDSVNVYHHVIYVTPKIA